MKGYSYPIRYQPIYLLDKLSMWHDWRCASSRAEKPYTG